MIEVREATVRFASRGITALDGISFTVDAGERIALVGPSGSGKTTLLRLLVGAVGLSGGTVVVGGRSPGQDRRSALWVRRRTGIVRQGDDLIGSSSAGLNIAIGATGAWRALDWVAAAAGRTPPGLAERVRSLAETHGIEQCLAAPVDRLSGGQRQRVAVCRALIGRPHLLLADEPTTGLDPVKSEAVLGALLDASPTTVLVSTHDLRVASRFDRIIGLSAGRIVHDGGMPAAAQQARIYGSIEALG